MFLLMPPQEQVLRMATSFANTYIEEYGYEALSDQSFDELVDTFNDLVEMNEERFAFE